MKKQTSIDMSDISSEFVKSAQKHLKSIKSELGGMSSSPAAKKEAVASIFRSLHSLKGAAMLLGFEKVATLAHAMENVLAVLRGPKGKGLDEQIEAFLEAIGLMDTLLEDPSTVSYDSLHAMSDRLHSCLGAAGLEISASAGQVLRVGDGDDAFTIDALTWKRHKESGQYLYILNFDLVSLLNRRKLSPMALIDELMACGQILDARLSSPLERLEADFKDYPLYYEVLFSSPADQVQLAVKLPRVEFKPMNLPGAEQGAGGDEAELTEESKQNISKSQERSKVMSENKGRKMVEEEDILDEEEEDSQKDKYLTFRIANEDYGLEIAYVTEIVGIQSITEVPDMPDFVKGVINLRGQVIPVIDVRLRFRLQPRAYDDRTCVVVVNINNNSIGLIVDTVNEVLDIPASQVSAPPKVHGGANGRYIQGMGKVGDTVKILLDVNKLLYEGELQQLTEATA